MTSKLSPAPDPWTRYDGPEELLRDPSLSGEEKHRLLEEWERDLRQLQTATEENMAADTDPVGRPRDGHTADLLQRVSNCRLAIGKKS